MTHDTAHSISIDMQEEEFEFHCITCSDQALPFTVVSVNEATCMATVAVGKGTEEVDISLVDAVMPGDTILVHGGVALTLVSERRESSQESNPDLEDSKQ